MTKNRNIAAAGGSMPILIEERTMSGNSVEDFIFDNSRYSSYFFDFINIKSDTDNDGFYAYVSRDTGFTFDSGVSDYFRFFVTYENTLTAAQNTTNVHNIASGVGNNTTEYGVTGHLEVIFPGLSVYTHLNSIVQYNDTSGNAVGRTMSTVRASAAAVDALRIQYQTGALDSGIIRFWGQP